MMVAIDNDNAKNKVRVGSIFAPHPNPNPLILTLTKIAFRVWCENGLEPKVNVVDNVIV